VCACARVFVCSRARACMCVCVLQQWRTGLGGVPISVEHSGVIDTKPTAPAAHGPCQIRTKGTLTPSFIFVRNNHSQSHVSFLYIRAYSKFFFLLSVSP